MPFGDMCRPATTLLESGKWQRIGWTSSSEKQHWPALAPHSEQKTEPIWQ